MFKILKITSFILFFSLCSVVLSKAQTRYPIEVMPNQTKTLNPVSDTLWVLTNRQVKRAILDAKKLKLQLKISKELNDKMKLMQQKGITKDSLVVDLTKDRDFYMNNWNDCKKDVKTLIAKNKRQRLFTRLSFGGMVVAFIAGFLIGR